MPMSLSRIAIACGIAAAWSRIRVTGLLTRPTPRWLSSREERAAYRNHSCLHLRAEVGADHVGMMLHLVGLAGGDGGAEVEHHHPVSQVHDEAHVVLHHDDRHAELVAD